jgi:hypothetical protein
LIRMTYKAKEGATLGAFIWRHAATAAPSMFLKLRYGNIWSYIVGVPVPLYEIEITQ